MKVWAWDEKNLPSITRAIRAAVAATISVINRAARANARDLLGCDRYFGRNHCSSRCRRPVGLNINRAPGKARERLLRCRNVKFSSSKSCRPAFKRGMTERTTEQLSPNGIGCQIQDITKI
jgi:hypothetical protein